MSGLNVHINNAETICRRNDHLIQTLNQSKSEKLQAYMTPQRNLMLKDLMMTIGAEALAERDLQEMNLIKIKVR